MSRSALFVLAAVRAVAAADFPFGANFGNVAKLATTDAGYSACISVEDIVSTCYLDVPSTASALESASCYCCNGGAAVYAGYRSCESYILASATQYTDDYTLASVAASFCSQATSAGFQCGGGNGNAATTTSRAATTTPATASATATDTDTASAATASSAAASAGTDSGSGSSSPSATAVSSVSSLVAATSSAASATVTGGSTSGSRAPAECESFADIFSSCSSSVAGFATMRDPQVASCLCYDSGRYTTAFDGYVSTCGVWAKTAVPEQYSTYLLLQTFCDDYSPTGTATATSSAAGATFGSGSSDTTSDSSDSTSTASDRAVSLAGSLTSSPTTTGQRTVTIQPSEAATTSASTGAGARGPAVAGFAAWMAVILPVAAVW